MTRSGAKAYRWRWLLLIVGLLITAAGVAFALVPHLLRTAGLMGTPLYFPIWADFEMPSYYASTALVLGEGLILQCLFLRPRRGIALRLTETGRPLKGAAIAAGLMGSLLTVGLVATLLEIPNWWESMGSFSLIGSWVAIAVLWIVWGVIFAVFWKAGDEYTRLTRIIRGLLAGSVLELLVAAPVQAMVVSQKRECYCARGSYTGLVLGGTVILWLFGPGIVLLFLREKHRRERFLKVEAPETCDRCGYDLRGSTAAGRTACPECGHDFTPSPKP